jgi:regulator of replication initiation timing
MNVFQIDEVYSEVEAMNSSCNDMMSRLQTTKSQTRDLINETTKLQNENQKLILKGKVMQTFLAKFQLSVQELQALKGNTTLGKHGEIRDGEM